jgi:hypothetical protein
MQSQFRAPECEQAIHPDDGERWLGLRGYPGGISNRLCTSPLHFEPLPGNSDAHVF